MPTPKKRKAVTDKERLDRILLGVKRDGTDIIVRANRYGFEADGSHALGNPCLTILDRADIDAVIRSERRATRRTAR
jgi:hypothetical protein